MKKFLALVVIAIAAISIFAFAKTREQPARNPNPTTTKASATPFQDEDVNIKASFIIKTNGLTRNFSAKMYHNLSPDVYIEEIDPWQVYVKKKGITWNDFFKTLPMELTKECLITGTKETFCTGESGTLRFYLNNVEEKDLLNQEIKDGDKALIQF